MATWGLLIPGRAAMMRRLKSRNPLLRHLLPLRSYRKSVFCVAKEGSRGAAPRSAPVSVTRPEVPTGEVITVKSTPLYLIGGPLADTDIALKRLPIRGGALQRVEEIKVEDKPKSY